ncbi:MAG: phosphoribosyltransferase family protein [Ruminococcus sp.]|nr:phosphoribosyltransferase family protein [Ruminococcus sp.]
MEREKLRKIAALLYPTRCPVCGEVIGANDCFCEKCTDILVPYTGSFRVKGSPKFVAAYEYHPNMSEAVMLMKRGVMGNAPYAFGSEIAARIREAGMDRADLLVPVPMFKADLRSRGANQSLLIAQEVGRRLAIPVDGKSVVKSVETLPQKELRKREREVNLRGAFTVAAPEAVKGRTIILIDDLCTTGSTLAEVTAVLLGAGAAEVYCACACKAVEHEEEEDI